LLLWGACAKQVNDFRGLVVGHVSRSSKWITRNWGNPMTQNKDEIIVFLADIERATEKAVRLDLTTAIYLLRMVKLDATTIVYQGEENALPDRSGSASTRE
jgi:hypothetical protein